MKKWLFVLFLFIFVGVVIADTAKLTMVIGQSIEIGGKNVTVLRFDETEQKAVLCINNYRYIFGSHQPNIVDNLKVEVTRIRLQNIDLTLKTVKISNVDCTDACNNDLCGKSEEPGSEVVTQPQPGEIPASETPSTPSTTTPSTTTTSSNTNIYIVIFIIALIILIVISAILVFKRV